MKINWLWDSKITVHDAKEILSDEHNQRFERYMVKLLSRVSDPQYVLTLINEEMFCKKWPLVKKAMKKDRWLKSKVFFWQTIYERIHDRLKKQGVKIRKSERVKTSPVRARLAEQIKKLRVTLGYTQADVAKRLGVIQQYVSRIESGKENVTVDTLNRIAQVFGKHLSVHMQ